jgi:hypothetical protein
MARSGGRSGALKRGPRARRDGSSQTQLRFGSTPLACAPAEA